MTNPTPKDDDDPAASPQLPYDFAAMALCAAIRLLSPAKQKMCLNLISEMHDELEAAAEEEGVEGSPVDMQATTLDVLVADLQQVTGMNADW